MTQEPEPDLAHAPSASGTAAEVFLTFLELGLTSFGGPIAHLGYFRNELVLRRRWLDDAAYADLVALCQFLPGPTSSQVGFALGLLRGGPLGALAAWTAFTLPSALLRVLFAATAFAFDSTLGTGIIHGLKIVAVVVVAQAVWGMSRTLTPDRQRIAIAVSAMFVVLAITGAPGQIAAITLGCLGGLWLCRGGAIGHSGLVRFPVSRGVGLAALGLFLLLLLGLPLVAGTATGIALFDAFYRAGALVFGGGHVVLPLLQAAVVPPGWVSDAQFLAGYGAAQVMPGPLFSFAAYLGALLGDGLDGAVGAATALVAIFVPGLLLVVGALPFWNTFQTIPQAQSLMRGANAAVVGILGAALYDPVWLSAVRAPTDFALTVLGVVLLGVFKAPVWLVAVLLAAGGALSSFIPL